MIRRLLITIALISACHGIHMYAGKPHHPSPGRTERTKATTRTRLEPTVVYDTISTGAIDSIAVSGFEKAQTSSRESMFVTNNTGHDISATGIEISYMDMQGRMLHKASHTVAEVIPAGETRLVSVPSFDRQNLFYYHMSPMSRRAAQATPFDVRVTVKFICYPKLQL